MTIMLPRNVFSEDHESFRTTVRRFLETEVRPYHEEWEDRGIVPREIWQRAGELGLLLTAVAEEDGGVGGDRLFSAVVIEEVSHTGLSGLGFNVHSDIVAIYIAKYGSEAQKQRWLPAMARGEAIGAVAMTEPGTGSDLQSIRTSARQDGDDFILNGSKTFITNGYNCDVVIVAAKIESEAADHSAVTLFLVDTASEGFRRGRNLSKLGTKAQDTAELFFDDVRLPASSVLGGAGMGFGILMSELAWERLMIAISAVAAAHGVFEETVSYVKERQVFGKPLSKFQNTRFKLAQMKTEIQFGQAFVDRCMALEMRSELPIDAAASAKYWTTEMLGNVADEGLQLFGGYGYMLEYPISKAYADARVQRIYGGTTEIMKEIVARSIC